MRILKSAAVTAALFLFAACSGSGSVIPAPHARIVLNADSPRPTIDVVDIPADQLGQIYGTDSRDAWTAILKVSVGAAQPAAVGQYAIEDTRIRFTPMFPLEHGREYYVTFTPPGGQPVTATVGLPPADTTPTTTVTQVYPTVETVPENLLRLYIDFSAPMGARGGLDLVHLLDDTGKDVKGAFLPLDAEFWNDARTRYTVFVDPDRQLDEGRSLTAGRTYTLVVDAPWPDSHGLPLKQAFRRSFKVGPPDEKPLDPKTWKIEAPMAGSTDALTVTFPKSLDHGLLMRALGVLAPGGKPLEGEVIVGPEELSWQFTPDQPWKAGTHNLSAMAMLEDLAGNRIGRAFDVAQFNRLDKSVELEKTLMGFQIK